MMSQAESELFTKSDHDVVIRVLLFSVLRERLGSATADVPIPAGGTVSDLLDSLCARHPEVKPYRSMIRVGVNAEYADATRTIAEDDEVAVITPVSGG